MSTPNPSNLLTQAKRYVDQQEAAGRDWQAAVNDILSDATYAPLFEGLSDEEQDALCAEISLGLA